ncbi:MAG: ATP-dependent DNA helicase RecG [Epulopiscium sp. Nele67-Bin001]|nr:MAG: ATP-dependent DNA helicase RecG [Epulopiscium sp. Nele67-Bin001]
MILDLKGVGEQTAAKFYKLGIVSIKDLVEHYPKEHEDRRSVVAINNMAIGEVNNIIGRVVMRPEVSPTKYGIRVSVWIGDGTGKVKAVFFGQPYLKSTFIVGELFNFYGKVMLNGGKFEMQSPEFQKACNYTAMIVPIYASTVKLSQKVIRQHMANALKVIDIVENLPQELLEKYKLMGKKEAINNIHFPVTPDSFFQARRRLVFEELFLLQLCLYKLKQDFKTRNEGTQKHMPDDFNSFIKCLPFKLTGAQKRVTAEILKDMSSVYATNRLIQGDVGSGKTAIAAISLFVAVRNGYQAALMAPTEVLARQHFEFLEQLFKQFNINVALLTGSITKKQKRLLLEDINSIDIVVGTHALLEDNVTFNNLGLVITDEQHRFGVRQRFKFSDKGVHPDVLVMSATPIPRTLALILYGDMDISVIDELPPGRVPIKTNAVTTGYYDRIFSFMRTHIGEGRQCYIICPMVEENEKLEELKSVVEYSNELRESVFKGYRVEHLHGKMKGSQKNEIMERFAGGEVDILVSTTVVEVGVNVPNATIMLIENAERFGLAQLHQLRGRVGRGLHESFCILVSDSKNKDTKERLKIMQQSTDGFVIADTDLKLRGGGDFFGTKQHGLPEMKIANLYTDMEVLKIVQAQLEQDKDVLEDKYGSLLASRMQEIIL